MKFICKECGARNVYDDDKFKGETTVELPCRQCGEFNVVEVPSGPVSEEEDDDNLSANLDNTSVYNVEEEVSIDIQEEPSVGQTPSDTYIASQSGVSEGVPPVVPIAPESISRTHSKRNWTAWGIVGALLLIICGVGGWWYYDNIYLPEKIDREAPRSYPIVNVNLRSSKMAGSDYNKLTSVPYGGELITYNTDSEWAEVKYVLPDGSKSAKGYVASPYLLSKKDMYLLNSIFGDNDSREILATSKVRKALLNYYKDKGYVGKIDPELMQEVGLSAGNDSQWQVFFPHGDQKPNEVVFKRLISPDSKFTDMGLIIKNINSGERKFLYFYFDDDESPHFAGEMAAPRDGVLNDVMYVNGSITPIFTY